MGHQFDSKSDTVLFRSREVFAYYKAIEQPVYVVEPVGQAARAVIIYVHGLCENAFRFMHTAKHWAGLGYQVVMFHLKGHGCKAEQAVGLHWLGQLYLEEEDPRLILKALAGMSDERHELCKEICKANIAAMATTTMEDHLDQLECVLSELGEGDGPVFISGHSLGGLIACEGSYRNPGAPGAPGVKGKSHGVVGTILFSPALRPIGPGGLDAVVQFSWYCRRSKWLKPVAWGLDLITAVDMRLPSGAARNFVSDIPEQCHLHFEDPLVLNGVKSSYLKRIEQQMLVTIDRGKTYPHDAIVIASEGDQIVNTLGAKAFGNDLQIARGIKSNPVKIYEGAFAHNPLRSTMTKEVLGKVEEWMRAKIGE